jgi:NitT/TauT family transport system ATP-binding protein
MTVRELRTAPVAQTEQKETASAPYIEIRDVSKKFVNKKGTVFTGVTEVNLSIAKGSFVSIVGPSGCGKSTLLTMISGLSSPTTGSVQIEGQTVSDVQDNMGLLFQKDVLFPWKTVLGNVELPLQFRGVEKREARKRAFAWIERVGLNGFEHHYPHQLSGGMRKRVSMAQTFVYDPEVILMDEPFSALDVHTRNRMENELMEIWSGSGRTVVFVTHDLEEAIALSTHVVVFTKSPGRIKSVYEIDLPYPRNVAEIKFEPKFPEIYQTIWNDLREEVASSGL